MLNKRKEFKAMFLIATSILIITLGIIMIVRAFSTVRTELIKEHHEHLLDIAYSTDQNIAALLDRCDDELNFTIDLSDHDLNENLDRSKDNAQQNLSDSSVLHSRYISKMLITEGNTIVTCIPADGERNYSFPYGGMEEKVGLCEDDTGREYLAVRKEKTNGTRQYYALIDLNHFFSLVLGDKLGEDYWMGLYNESAALMLQNDPEYPLARVINADDGMSAKRGYATLIKSELDQTIMTKAYVLELEESQEEERLIAAIPSSESSNGEFAVAISVESEQYFKVIRHLVWRILLYSVLILTALCVMISLLYKHRRKSDEMREQTKLLQEKNENMQALLDKTQELAHHQRLELIGTMTSSIAHEFNNLLTPIMGYSLMTIENLPEGNEELFDNVVEIYEASVRAKTLVSRLSSLSRKGFSATAHLLSPDAVIAKVHDVAMPSLPRMVQMVEDLHCPEACLYADETQFAQAVLNIIINAFQAMEEKGGTLTISTALEEDQIVIRFSDTGPGMTEEVLEHIFEPFYTTKDVSRGTGLGLAIVKQSVESQQGEIHVDSTVGVGTTFTIRFPNRRNTAG